MQREEQRSGKEERNPQIFTPSHTESKTIGETNTWAPREERREVRLEAAWTSGCPCPRSLGSEEASAEAIIQSIPEPGIKAVFSCSQPNKRFYTLLLL